MTEKEKHNNYGLEKCQFCEMGVYNRGLAHRIIKTMSRLDMKELLRERALKKIKVGKVLCSWKEKDKKEIKRLLHIKDKSINKK